MNAILIVSNVLFLLMILFLLYFINYLVNERDKKRDERAKLAALYVSADKHATTNEVTGLPNKRSLEEKVENIFSNFARPDSRIGRMTVVFLDLDGFKKFNDTYSHSAGDYALRVFAEILRNTLRGMDNFAHVGGDEFVLVLEDITEEGIEKLLSRIEILFTSYTFPFVEEAKKEGKKVIKHGLTWASASTSDKNVAFSQLLEIADSGCNEKKEAPGGSRYKTTR